MSDPLLLPKLGEQSALERKFAKRILALHPGLGEKAGEIANALADSGMSGATASLLMLSVYAPDYDNGRGQSTRMRFFVEAVKNRYSHKLEKIKNDPGAFKLFVADMEEVAEMRDTLNGEDVKVSFQAAFLLWELGMNADTVLATVQDVLETIHVPGLASKFVVRAAQMVKSGHFTNLDSAIAEMRHGYDSSFRD